MTIVETFILVAIAMMGAMILTQAHLNHVETIEEIEYQSERIIASLNSDVSMDEHYSTIETIMENN